MDIVELLEALTRPEAYPHPVERVHAIQTHTSCVFLTGDYAYKIKKPVEFGFLDYSTPERRAYFCREELRLNRRFCAEAYLEVLPVTRGAGGVRIAGDGPAIDWALRMRQLPEEDLLSNRLAGGSAGPDDIRRVARRIAAAHRESACSPAIAEAGSPGAVRRNVEENFRQTEGRAGCELPPGHLEAIRGFAEDALDRRPELFVERMSGGWVRDGHGDLRAQNICLYPGLGEGVQILDCIEFSARFRHGDVAADLAYLAMDLDLAGRADLRRVLVDQYRESMGKGSVGELFPFYLCYRAYVRAKIALLAAEEPEIPLAQRLGHGELAAAAFDLARSYAERPRGPELLLMNGYSGSGKSALAGELARRLGAVRVSTDEIRKTDPGAKPDYTGAARDAVYGRLLDAAGPHLEAGERVILDATFLEERHRAAAARAARQAGATMRVILCRCPDSVIRSRIAAREAEGRDASDADLAVYEQQRARYSLLVPGRGSGGVAVDTSAPLTESVRTVLHEIWNVGRR